MRHLPRALNRTLLFIFGLLSLLIGAGMLLVSYWPPAESKFSKITAQLAKGHQEIWNQSLVLIPGLPAQKFSWLAIAWIALAVVLVLLLLGWIFSQGGGKVKELNLFGQTDHQDEAGEIIAQLPFVDDLVQDAIADERWIDSVKTSAWEVKKKPGISLSVVAFKGADLAHLKQVIDQAIARIDSVLEKPVPVAVHLTTNWRSNFKSVERVDNS